MESQSPSFEFSTEKVEKELAKLLHKEFQQVSKIVLRHRDVFGSGCYWTYVGKPLVFTDVQVLLDYDEFSYEILEIKKEESTDRYNLCRFGIEELILTSKS
jgi:hypothetical protein